MLSLAVLAAIIASASALPDGTRKIELMLPMRDGVKLHTEIFLPRAEGKYTAIVDRSPYGYGDMEWITDIFLPFGFVAVGQDMRGTEMSEGNFTMWVQDKDDSQDLGDWIVQQEWSDGKIMTFGASADGLAAFQTPFNNPSWLAAQYFAWCPSAMYDILFPKGTYKQETTEDWLYGLTMPIPEVVNDNLQTIYDHEMHDEFWAQIELSPDVYKNVRYPSAFWGGWYDLFSVGTILAHEGFNTMSDESVRFTSKLTMDPLGHCLGGAEYFTEDAIMGRTGVVIAQLFETFGIRPVARTNIKNITFYVMSSNDEAGINAGQYWSSLEKWPTPTMTDFYFHADGTASMLPPTDLSSSTSYVHDPSNPVFGNGGANLPPDIGGDIACGPLDQAAIDTRSDVLSYQTEVFKSELALTGPMFATLYVSSDAVDTDFMVRISDVYPTGEVRLIQDNAIRMRWRNDKLSPEFLKKGEVYEVSMNIWNTSYVVAPGHSLRFAISSSNNPRFSINRNNGLLLADPTFPGPNITATNTLHHSVSYMSRVSLPLVLKHQIPQIHLIKEVQTGYPQITEEVIRKQAKAIERMVSRMGKNKKQ